MCHRFLIAFVAASASNVDELKALSWSSDLFAGLAELHGADVMHNDISPRNVFVDIVGGREVIKIGDYGLAENVKNRAGKKTRKCCGMDGPPQSPESADNKDYSFQHDVFCAGSVVHMVFSLAVRDNDDSLDTAAAISAKYDAAMHGPIQSLLSKVLCIDPDKRISAVAARNICVRLCELVKSLRGDV